MPAKQKTERRRASEVNADIDNDNDKQPSWNTSDTTLATYLLALEQWLPSRHPELQTLVEQYFVVERRQVCCVSDNHIDRLRKEGLIPIGSWRRPTVVDRTTDNVTGLGTAIELAAAQAQPDRKRYEVAPETIAVRDRELGARGGADRRTGRRLGSGS